MELKLPTIPHVAVFLVMLILINSIWKGRKSPKAPGIGYGSIPLLGPWRGAIAYMKDPKGTIAKGCEMYKGGYFKVASHTDELLLVADKKKVAEYLAAPDDVLSFEDSVNEFLQTEWTLGEGVAHRQYHVALVRTKLTQTIAANTPAMLREVQDVFAEQVGSPKDWTEVPLYKFVVALAARISNNAFSSGLGLSSMVVEDQAEAYQENAIAYAQSVIMSAELIRLFPTWMKPWVAKLTPFRKQQKLARELMGPLVQKRLDTKWDEEKEKPNDMIQILIDAAPPVERTMPQIVERMMTLNMASIHTTSMTLTAAVYMLGSPEGAKYVPALREEVERYSIDGKIDKMALGKLVKLDSFLRECGRVIPLGLISLVRVARKEFRFSDGMVIPKGGKVAAPIDQFHNEGPEIPDSAAFDGFRYSSLNAQSTGPTRHQMVNTDLNYLLFGHGKHACPGRFLAVTELKLIFATLLLQYDVTLIPGTAPKDIYFGKLSYTLDLNGNANDSCCRLSACSGDEASDFDEGKNGGEQRIASL